MTLENYNQGFLLDEELMAGVTPHPDLPDTYIAFVLQHMTGEYVGYQSFSRLSAAIQAINQIQRPWKFEKIGGCGGCGEGGSCQKKGSCSGSKCSSGTCSTLRKLN